MSELTVCIKNELDSLVVESEPNRNVSTQSETELAAQHRAFLAAATSDNTRRSYRSAIRHFLAWGGALPGDEATLIRYLVAHASTLNVRTLALRLTALSQWHVHQGFADPASLPAVRKTLAGIARVHGAPKKKAKALPLEDFVRMVVHLSSLPTLSAKRDSALLQLGYFGAYRRSELVSLQVEHVAWVPEGMILTLPRSKTDQHGEGIVKAIPYGAGPCCPSTALRAWLTVAKISSGWLFRPINRWDVVSEAALHAGSVSSILAQCASQIGLDYAPCLSSHSLRRGMATSAHRAGAPLHEIKRQGGWRHDGTVQGYIEEADQFQHNAAGRLLGARIKLP